MIIHSDATNWHIYKTNNLKREKNEETPYVEFLIVSLLLYIFT